jgi:hypothetical protein
MTDQKRAIEVTDDQLSGIMACPGNDFRGHQLRVLGGRPDLPLIRYIRSTCRHKRHWWSRKCGTQIECRGPAAFSEYQTLHQAHLDTHK